MRKETEKKFIFEWVGNNSKITPSIDSKNVRLHMSDFQLLMQMTLPPLLFYLALEIMTHVECWWTELFSDPNL